MKNWESMGFEHKITTKTTSYDYANHYATTDVFIFTPTLCYKLSFKWFKGNHGGYMGDEGARRPIKS